MLCFYLPPVPVTTCFAITRSAGIDFALRSRRYDAATGAAPGRNALGDSFTGYGHGGTAGVWCCHYLRCRQSGDPAGPERRGWFCIAPTVRRGLWRRAAPPGLTAGLLSLAAARVAASVRDYSVSRHSTASLYQRDCASHQRGAALDRPWAAELSALRACPTSGGDLVRHAGVEKGRPGPRVQEGRAAVHHGSRSGVAPDPARAQPLHGHAGGPA